MKIILLSILFVLFAVPATSAEDHAYIILYSDPERGIDYQSLNNLSNNNNILIGHMRFVDAMLPNDQINPPLAASLFIAKDAEHLVIPSNLEEIEAIFLLGKMDGRGGINFLKKSPMAAIVFSSGWIPAPENGLTFTLSTRLIYGETDPQFYAQIKQVTIFPLSFDDNPMEFMPVNHTKGMMGLIGEFQR